MKFNLLFTRRWILLYVPIFLLCAFVLWFSAVVWMPLPPNSMVMATGTEQSRFAALATQYRDRLDAKGLRVDLVTGSVRSLAKTANTNKVNDLAGFTLGLNNVITTTAVASERDEDDLEALAAVERQPLWVFTRQPGVISMEQLRGLRIATSDTGSTIRSVTELALAHAGLQPADVVLQAKPGKQGANDLIDGKVDALITIAQSESDVVRLLTRSPGIFILGVERVTALLARETRLKAFVLPQGAIELRGDIPARDLTMVAGHLHLVVNNGMHPALQRLLIDAAYDIHEAPSFLQRQSEFPNLRNMDLPASPTSEAMALGKRPWMEQLLPYYWAQLAELLLYAVLPILALTLMVLAWIPYFFEWRVNAILQNHYGELKFLETEIEPTAAGRPLDIKRLLQRLDQMEQQVVALDLPVQFSNRWYTLRAHLASARERLLSLRAR